MPIIISAVFIGPHFDGLPISPAIPPVAPLLELFIGPKFPHWWITDVLPEIPIMPAVCVPVLLTWP